MALTILIAEDEESILSPLKLNLELEGYEVIATRNGIEAVEAFRLNAERISLALLDIMMPGKDGLQVCSEIKNIQPDLPVIFLTARADSKDKITGLKTGAEDYIVKPFDLEELLLRMNNVLKRFSKEKQKISVFQFGKNTIDFDRFEINGITGHQSLSKREIELLRLLVEKKNQVVSRDLILETVWEADENPSARTIDNMILNFRKYFEPNPKEPKYFHSVRGVGYKFTADPPND